MDIEAGTEVPQTKYKTTLRDVLGEMPVKCNLNRISDALDAKGDNEAGFHDVEFKAGPDSIDESERSVVHIISTADVDRQLDIMVPKGADWGDMEKTRSVFLRHDTGDVVGKMLWIKRKKDGLLAKTEFAQTPLGEEWWQLVKNGFVMGWSVGFVVKEVFWDAQPQFKDVLKSVKESIPGIKTKDANRIVTKWDIYEYSVAPMPANVDALSKALDEKEITLSKKTYDIIYPDGRQIPVKAVSPDIRVIKMTPDIRVKSHTHPEIRILSDIKESLREAIDRQTGRIRIVRYDKS